MPTETTAERSWTFLDKSGWGPGPWVDEPDKVEWVDQATGLDCLAVRGGHGSWCGYVGVPPGHPAFEKEYEHPAIEQLGAHGGLNFARHCAPPSPDPRRVLRGWGGLTPLPDADLAEWRVCHVGRPGAPEPWWLGFDCAHAGDFDPAANASLVAIGSSYRRLGMPRDYEVYRDLPYVRAECADLARQLAAMEAP